MNPEKGIVRCFMGLYPDSAALNEIVPFVDCMRQSQREIRWEKSSHIHITAKFIGDIDIEAIRSIEQAMRETLAGYHTIKGEIDRTGTFPNSRNPRIIWLGFRDPPEKILALHSLLEQVCARHGVEKERKSFTPHFTVGRVRRGRQPVDLEKDLQACSFQTASVIFEDFRIMKSTLTPAGAIHDELARIRFKGEQHG